MDWEDHRIVIPRQWEGKQLGSDNRCFANKNFYAG
jgi:hypothetical protein